jgi:hypothetical protein
MSVHTCNDARAFELRRQRGRKASIGVELFRMNQEPPRNVRYQLDEALELLASLEDARDALLESRQPGVLIGVEDQIRLLGRRLDFEDPEGDNDER